jgi:hypothetical protein
MIRIQMFDTPAGLRRRMYENLVPVGKPRPAERTNQDLASNQLCQFFLRKFFQKQPALLPRSSSRSNVFLIDGKAGPQTLEGINRFQSFQHSRGVPLFLDQRVSVPLGVNVPGTQKRYTIHLLNSVFFALAGEEEFNNLSQNQEIRNEASELAGELVRAEEEVSA